MATATIETLQKQLEYLQAKPELFADTIANVESAIQTAVFNGKVGDMLDKLDITRIRGVKGDDGWAFTTMQTSSDASNANGNSVRNRVWPPGRAIKHGGKTYGSFAALCRFLKVPYGQANARAYLESHNPGVYARVVEESKAA